MQWERPSCSRERSKRYIWGGDGSVTHEYNAGQECTGQRGHKSLPSLSHPVRCKSCVSRHTKLDIYWVQSLHTVGS
jgi:hypothetical protein